jgi:hypothetical protein
MTEIAHTGTRAPLGTRTGHDAGARSLIQVHIQLHVTQQYSTSQGNLQGGSQQPQPHTTMGHTTPEHCRGCSCAYLCHSLGNARAHAHLQLRLVNLLKHNAHIPQNTHAGQAALAQHAAPAVSAPRLPTPHTPRESLNTLQMVKDISAGREAVELEQ